MEMLQTDLFTRIVKALPPASLGLGQFRCVEVQFDAQWHDGQAEDFGRTSFEIIFHRIKDEWHFKVSDKLWPVELLVDTIRRLPAISSVACDFVTMHVSERLEAWDGPMDGIATAVELRNAMFHKAFFTNPQGGRPVEDWAIRVGAR